MFHETAEILLVLWLVLKTSKMPLGPVGSHSTEQFTLLCTFPLLSHCGSAAKTWIGCVKS